MNNICIFEPPPLSHPFKIVCSKYTVTGRTLEYYIKLLAIIDKYVNFSNQFSSMKIGYASRGMDYSIGKVLVIIDRYTTNKYVENDFYLGL